MFLGHYALGLAAKRLAPKTSLGALIAAPTLADLLWPVFLLIGWERVTVVPGPNPFLIFQFDSYPISHSLLTLVGWGLLFAVLYRMRTGNAQGAVILGLLVVSHWVLDYVTHRPDLPLFPWVSSPKVGLALWDSPVGTIIVEGIMFVAGTALYLKTTRARDRVGSYGLAVFLAVLVLSYLAAILSPPPTNMRALAIGGIVFGWLFVACAAWIDGHREGVVGR